MTIQPPFAPEAVVFDLDGLLVDSEPAWERAERRVVADAGVTWDPAIRDLLLGRGPDDCARLMAEAIGTPDVTAVGRQLLVAAADEFRRGVPARPGALTLVSELAGRIPLAVATNSRRVLADLALVGSGLDQWLAQLVAAEDVANPKPAPDPYLAACTMLGADPLRTVVFEDSPVGIASASAAGCFVIAVPSVHGQDGAGADAVVASLADIDAASLAGRGVPRR